MGNRWKCDSANPRGPRVLMEKKITQKKFFNTQIIEKVSYTTRVSMITAWVAHFIFLPVTSKGNVFRRPPPRNLYSVTGTKQQNEMNNDLNLPNPTTSLCMRMVKVPSWFFTAVSTIGGTISCGAEMKQNMEGKKKIIFKCIETKITRYVYLSKMPWKQNRLNL